MKIEDILADHQDLDIDIEKDDRYPFPLYELEIQWKEWRWNAARTNRLNETIPYGVTVNPDDYLNEDGRIEVDRLKNAIKSIFAGLRHNENVVGPIRVVC